MAKKKGDDDGGDIKKIGKKSGGGKLSRSETVTVRLDPKLRFAAELAARKHRRTLSSFIEWAVEESVQNVCLDGLKATAYDAIDLAWDVDESDKFVKMALYYPNLLTHEEEVLWKLIRENGYLWEGYYRTNKLRGVGEWTWKIDLGSFIFEHLRENWESFGLVAKGRIGLGCLPGWTKEKELEIKEPMDKRKRIGK
mgnify:CR=1 FL=1|jgi:hypothetical protein